jgi:pyrimidine-nucleoside phosphorylase
MDQPLGSMIGNALEIIESIEILQGKGPKDTRELTVELGAEMLLLGAKVDSLEAGRLMLKESLDSGRAFKKFLEMVEIQGGNVSYILEPARFRPALQKVEIKAVKAGYISGINSRAIGHAVALLGAGRMTLKDEINAAVGLELLNKVGDSVFMGQTIAIMHVDNKGLDAAKQRIEDAISIGNDSLSPPKLCYERISTLEK